MHLICNNSIKERQERIQHLADILIEDIFRVTECKGNESSVEKARCKALGWFNQLIEMLEENFDIKIVRAESEDKHGKCKISN